MSCSHRRLSLLAAPFFLFASQGTWATQGHDEDTDRVCSPTAKVLSQACASDVADNYLVTVATCMNLTDRDARKECLADAGITRKDESRNCRAVYRARLKVCDALGEAAYEPPFGPDYADNFVDPLAIGASVTPNPYFPLIPGSLWKYKSTYTNEDGDEITEKDTVTVTNKTKLIEGITCVVVTDVVRSSDGTVEDTEDWFAQDLQGNVWYCGEIAQQKESFDGDQPTEPELVGIEGSWKAGRNGAKPGIQMLAFRPKVGKTYRQELAWVEAEDVGDVLSLNADASVSGGAFQCNNRCLQTRDYSALEPGADEYKYYAPGVGFILSVDLTNGTRTELMSYTHP